MNFSRQESQEYLDALRDQSHKEIYLDHAATTPLSPEVFECMKPYCENEYGNPSGFHSKSHNAKKALELAKKTIAHYCNCKTKNIIFTSGGTESVNFAILGFCRANKSKGNHIITSQVEHPAVLNTFKHLESQEGFDVSYLEVNEYGQVTEDILKDALQENTILCSLMYANNEIGTFNDIQKLGHICKKNNVIFHTDACQVPTVSNLDIEELNVDMMSLNGSKIYGPKGVGCLIYKNNIKIQPLLFGGSQQNNLRPGTENVAGIIGFAKALQEAQDNKDGESKRLQSLQEYFVKKMAQRIPEAIYNGHPNERLSFNTHFSISGIEGESIILYLNEFNIFISSGSACTSGSVDPSHVLLAIGRTQKESQGSLRFTFGKSTTQDDLEKTITILEHILNIQKNI